MPNELAVAAPQHIILPPRVALTELSRRTTPRPERRSEALKDVEGAADHWLTQLWKQKSFTDYRHLHLHRTIPEIINAGLRRYFAGPFFCLGSDGLWHQGTPGLTIDLVRNLALRIAWPDEEVEYHAEAITPNGPVTRTFRSAPMEDPVAAAIVHATLPLLRIPDPMPHTPRLRLWTATALLWDVPGRADVLRAVPKISGFLDPRTGRAYPADDAFKAPSTGHRTQEHERLSMERIQFGYGRLTRGEAWDGRRTPGRPRRWKTAADFTADVARAKYQCSTERQGDLAINLDVPRKTLERTASHWKIRIADVKPHP
jgi:hypothetical protein